MSFQPRFNQFDKLEVGMFATVKTLNVAVNGSIPSARADASTSQFHSYFIMTAEQYFAYYVFISFF